MLDKLVADGGDPTAIVETENLAMGGADELAGAVAAALEAEPESPSA